VASSSGGAESRLSSGVANGPSVKLTPIEFEAVHEVSCGLKSVNPASQLKWGQSPFSPVIDGGLIHEAIVGDRRHGADRHGLVSQLDARECRPCQEPGYTVRSDVRVVTVSFSRYVMSCCSRGVR
jgi:hypothetical protein